MSEASETVSRMEEQEKDDALVAEVTMAVQKAITEVVATHREEPMTIIVGVQRRMSIELVIGGGMPLSHYSYDQLMTLIGHQLIKLRDSHTSVQQDIFKTYDDLKENKPKRTVGAGAAWPFPTGAKN